MYLEGCVRAGTTPETSVNEAMEAAAAAVEKEGKSVLDALRDLHSHFGASATAPQADAPEGPSRLGKARRLLQARCVSCDMLTELLIIEGLVHEQRHRRRKSAEAADTDAD